MPWGYAARPAYVAGACPSGYAVWRSRPTSSDALVCVCFGVASAILMWSSVVAHGRSGCQPCGACVGCRVSWVGSNLGDILFSLSARHLTRQSPISRTSKTPSPRRYASHTRRYSSGNARNVRSARDASVICVIDTLLRTTHVVATRFNQLQLS